MRLPLVFHLQLALLVDETGFGVIVFDDLLGKCVDFIKIR